MPKGSDDCRGTRVAPVEVMNGRPSRPAPWAGVGLLLALAATGPARAWIGSPDLEPGLDPTQIVLFEDFERADWRNDWSTLWDPAPGPEVVTQPVFRGSRSLVLHSVEGANDSVGSGEFFPYAGDGEGLDQVYMRTYLRFEDGFVSADDQYKVLGIRGCTEVGQCYGGAGTAPTGQDKMAVVLATSNDPNGGLHLYVYHMDQPGGYGQHFWVDDAGLVILEPGRWYALEVGVRLNTPGQTDGEIKVWVDGQLSETIEGLRFRTIAGLRIRRFTIIGYHGGPDSAPRDEDTWWDNLVISRAPIGPAGDAPALEPPLPPTGLTVH